MKIVKCYKSKQTYINITDIPYNKQKQLLTLCMLGNMPYVDSVAPDQPVHMCNLIRGMPSLT